MHSVDPTTESMIRSVLAYAENRLRLNPVPLDRGSRDPAELDAESGKPLQPLEHPALLQRMVGFEACQYEYCLRAGRRGEVPVHRNAHAVAGSNRRAVGGNEGPLEQRRLRQPVGDEQGFRCRGDAEVRELRQQQKRDFAQTPS